MAESSRFPGDKAAWLRLADSWLRLLGGYRRDEPRGPAAAGEQARSSYWNARAQRRPTPN